MNLKNLLLEGTMTPAAKKCLNVVINRFGRSAFPSIGTYNYRKKRGGTSLSEHAYGNAIDFHVPSIKIPGEYDVATPKGKEFGNQVKDFLLQNTVELDIEIIIWYKQIWNISDNFTKRYYDGEHPHTDHVHVDFLREGRHENGNRNNKTIINQKNNTFLMKLIGGYYDISTKNPAGYFKQFRSWNPLSPGIGDNEEGAANKLLKRFDTYYRPKLKEIESSKTTSKEDLQNIQRIREIVDILYQAILDGRSETFDVTYFKFDSSTNSYKPKTMTFKWNYL
jgi:hypothetical protein